MENDEKRHGLSRKNHHKYGKDMVMNLDEILVSLPKLDNESLNKVKNRALALLSIGSDKDMQPVIADNDLDPIFRIVNDVISANGGPRMPYEHIRKSVNLTTLRERVKMIDSWLVRGKATAVAKPGLIQFGFELLIADFMQMKIPVSHRSLLQNIHRLPGIVDLRFPGYAANGMLGMIYRQKGT